MSHPRTHRRDKALTLPLKSWYPFAAAPRTLPQEAGLWQETFIIALKPGELRIEFYGAEDLAAKLLELSKAMANDWATFQKAVE